MDKARERFSQKSVFLRWCDSENLEVITGYSVKDLRKINLTRIWKRLELPSAYCHLEGSQGFTGALVTEIPAGKNSALTRHMYEEQILVLEGKGSTQFWSGGKNITLEWKTGSIFSPPLNTVHQHFNGSRAKPVRLIAVNNAPLVFNIFNSPDFVFNSQYEFSDRFSCKAVFFTSVFSAGTIEDLKVNFIPDAYSVKLDSHPERGKGFSRIGIQMSGNSMVGHIMQIKSGTYKKLHRHHAGTHIIVLAGKGYTLMWPPKGDRIRIDWQKGSLLVPPEGWYHSHFVTSSEDARHLALRRGLRHVGTTWMPMVSESEGGHMLEHENESSDIRKAYEEELAKEGLELKM